MKKAFLLSFLLLTAVFVPFMEGAEGLTVPSELVLQLDPVDDVVEIDEGGAQTSVGGHDEIDVLSFGASVNAGPVPGATDDFLELSMSLKGNVVTNDEDVKYIFAISFNSGTYLVLCNYSSVTGATGSFSCFVVSLEEGGEGFTTATPPSVTGGTDINVRIALLALGVPTTITSIRAGSADIRDDETKYADLAPDKLVKFTSPSEGATIGDAHYAFTGACHKSTDAFTDVEVKIDNGAWQDPTTTDGWETWSINIDLSALSGQHSITAKGIAGGVEYFDTLSFNVGDPGDSFDVLPPLHVGDVFTYGTSETAVIAELDVQVEAMTITIEKLEEITVGSDTYNCFKVHTFESASLEASVLEIEQNVNRDSWRIADDFETQQSIVKEYTHTAQSAMRSGSPLNSANTYTNLTYDAPFDPGYLGKTVGDWWSVTASGTQTSWAVPSEGDPEGKTTSPVKTAYNEVLRTEMVSLPSSLGGGSEECFIIKTSNGDNETSYSESAYSNKYPVPLRIEVYDGNRALIGALILEDRVIGPGTFFEPEGVPVLPDTSEAGEKISVSVIVENQGDTAGTAWVSLIVDDEEVDNATSSGDIAPGGTSTIALSWTPSALDVGTHDVMVMTQNGVRNLGTITITEAPAQDNMLIYALIAAAAVVAIALAVAIKRRGEKKLLEEHDAKMAGEAQAAAPAPAKEVSIEAGEVVIEAAGAPALTSEEKMKQVIGEKTPVKCGKCGATTSVMIDERPYKFKCPECGAKLLIR